MKTILFTSVFLITTLLASASHFIEGAFMHCYDTAYSNIGIDLSSEINAYQVSLIDSSDIRDATSYSFHSMYIDMANNNISSIKSSYDFLKKSENNSWKTISANCHNRISRFKLYKKTKIRVIQKELNELKKDSINEPTKSELAQVYVDNLDSTDFKQPYFKFYTLIAISESHNTEIKDLEDASKFNIQVLLTSTETILLNNEPTLLENLSREIFIILEDVPADLLDNYRIELTTYSGTDLLFLLEAKKQLMHVPIETILSVTKN
ncbi:MAG: hypothetical protein HRT72_06210 [Flavobacteriales bacterium]|nr:hypothetical protein [Flavobacteriales bacterium]